MDKTYDGVYPFDMTHIQEVDTWPKSRTNFFKIGRVEWPNQRYNYCKEVELIHPTEIHQSPDDTDL